MQCVIRAGLTQGKFKIYSCYGSCLRTALWMHEPFCFMRKIIGYDDDEWSHSSDDGSGYSNEGHNKQ
jgi:hypothetical protein